MVPAIFGTPGDTVNANVFVGLVLQLLLAVTLRLPEAVYDTVTVCVPCPAVTVAEPGTVQLYVVAFATDAIVYVTL